MRNMDGDTDRPAKGRILIVSANRDNAAVTSTRLRHRGYDVRVASHGSEALGMVRNQAPELILLDSMLPDIDGYELSRRIKNDHSLPFIPIILVTPRDSTQDVVAGLDAGADDYLVRPYMIAEFEARVRSMLRIKRLQDQLEERNRELRRLSTRDGLTDLFNHRHIHGLLDEEIERARRSEIPLSVAMLDVDHFKAVNDTYGHQAGDLVIQQIADILRENAREVDRLGRYGGEEFIAVLPGSDTDGGAAFAARVSEDVESRPFRIDGNDAIRVTLSAGVATFPSPGIEDARALIRGADSALYAAKTTGRARVVQYQAIRTLQTGTDP